MSEERFIELEIKVAYQEDLLHALNQIVCEQQQRLDRLEASNRTLHERLKNLQHEEPEQNIDQTPPHY